MASEDWVAAVAAFSELIDADPENAEGYAGRGQAYAALDKPEQAIADFTEALTLRPSWADAHRLRAVAYTALGDTEHAQADQTMAEAMTKLSQPDDTSDELLPPQTSRYQSPAGYYQSSR